MRGGKICLVLCKFVDDLEALRMSIKDQNMNGIKTIKRYYRTKEIVWSVLPP